MRFFIIFSILWCSCETEEQVFRCDQVLNTYEVLAIYMDSSCNNLDKVGIQLAIEQVNQFTMELMCQSRISLVGEIDVDHSAKSPGDEFPVIACYDSETSWSETKEFKGLYGHSYPYKDAKLFRFRKPHGTIFWSISLGMHELTHFIGVRGHNEDRDSVMFAHHNDKIHYNDSDRDLFCSQFDCVNW